MIPVKVLRELARSTSVPPHSRACIEATLRDVHAQQHFHFAKTRPLERPAMQSSFSGALVFHCERRPALPGRYVSSPINSSDGTVKFVYSHLSGLLRFFRECFGRRSFDDSDLSVLASVHYDHYYTNAFWNGYGLVFGSGDGLIFKSMASSDDFIGHEFMHGVTQYASHLEYSGEAGALNESYSDVFGSLYRQWLLGQSAAKADWMVGSGLMGPVALQNGWQCLRSLKDTKALYSLSKQASHYRDYIPGGGPHDNSGIPNHAFYLFAVAVGGNAWEKAGTVWYRTLISLKDPTIGFTDFALEAQAMARRIYPSEPDVAVAVRDAWKAVGVG